jgi:hypothetical protein
MLGVVITNSMHYTLLNYQKLRVNDINSRDYVVTNEIR